MKNLKALLLIAVITLGFNTIQAQTNVGHVDLGAVIKLMPETIKMNSDLEKLSKTYEDELVAKENTVKQLIDKYTAEAPSQTQDQNQQRAAEVQQEQQKIQQGYLIAQQDIEKKGNDMMEPIIQKARNAVDEVAKELNIQYVLDATTVITANGTDLTPKVKAKLGL